MYMYLVKLTKVAVHLQSSRPCRCHRSAPDNVVRCPPLLSVTDSSYCSSANPSHRHAGRLSLPPGYSGMAPDSDLWTGTCE